jgi:hypothetical protein
VVVGGGPGLSKQANKLGSEHVMVRNERNSGQAAEYVPTAYLGTRLKRGGFQVQILEAI